MKSSIDSIIADDPELQVPDQFHRLEAADPLAVRKLRDLFADSETPGLYEGLLGGCVTAFSAVRHSTSKDMAEQNIGYMVAVVASALHSLRPPSLQLWRSSQRVRVAGAVHLVLRPAEFAFYAVLAGRRKSKARHAGFMSWDTPDLVAEYLAEYRRVAAHGAAERAARCLPDTAEVDDGLRRWFEERKSRTNRQVEEQCGPVLGRVYRVASEGTRPNMLSGLRIDPDRIAIHD